MRASVSPGEWSPGLGRDQVNGSQMPAVVELSRTLESAHALGVFALPLIALAVT
jgi:hypothetical protein